MTGQDILKLIDKIAATPSKLSKEAFLAAHKEDKILQAVLVASLDPLISYGVKKLPEPTFVHTTKSDLNIHTWTLLEGLANRTLTGHAALAAIAEELDRLDEPSAELLRRVILKDLRAGFGGNTVNKVWPKLIQDPPYMRCSLTKDVKLAPWPWKDGIFSQEKADGMFANLEVKPSLAVVITSRAGSEFDSTWLDPIRDAASKTFKPGTVTMGEFIVQQDGVDLERALSNGVMNSLLKGGDLEANQVVTYRAWDQIPAEFFVSKGKCPIKYKARLMALMTQLVDAGDKVGKVSLIETKICRNQDQAMEHYRKKISQKKEGTVIKHPDGLWKDSTSKDQVKLKLEVCVELKVVGVNPGTGKFEGQIGSLASESSDALLKVNVSGRGDLMRAGDPKDWINSIITVKANSLVVPTRDGEPHCLFLPILVEKRDDKSEADSLEQIIKQFDSAIA